MSGGETVVRATLNQHSSYSIEHLPNGLIRVFSRASKLSSCFNPDGTYRHGDLRPPLFVLDGKIMEQITLDDTLRWLNELDCRDAN